MKTEKAIKLLKAAKLDCEVSFESSTSVPASTIRKIQSVIVKLEELEKAGEIPPSGRY